MSTIEYENMRHRKRNSESQLTDSNVDQHEEKQKSASVDSILENICWLAASALSVYFSDIINVFLYDQTIYRSVMLVAFCLISVNVCVAFYLIFWVSIIKKVDSEKWGNEYPLLIPFATACFVAGSLLLTVAIWPIYTWKTVPLLFSIFMGFIIFITSLPNFF